MGEGAYWPGGQTRMHWAGEDAVASSVVSELGQTVRWGVVCGPPLHVYPMPQAWQVPPGVAA